MIRRTIVLGILVTAACTPAAPPPTMPSPESGSVTSDPIRRAIQEAGAFFRRPQPNRPAEAARAIANIEFLAANVPIDPRWQASPATAITQLSQARSEGRRALDIDASAPSQGVIDGLLATATALESSDRTALTRALPRGIFRAGPEDTVRRLSQPPNIRSAGAALAGLSGGSSASR